MGRGARIPSLALLLAAPMVLPPFAGEAETAGIDLDPVRGAVESGLAAGAEGAAGRAYRKLDRALGKADRPGMADEFQVLRKVAKACGRPLAADAGLVDALGAALVEGEGALRVADTDVLALAAVLQSESWRGKVLAAAAKAREVRRDGEEALGAGLEMPAAARFGKASKKTERAARLAGKYLTKERNRPPAFDLALSGLGGALLGVWGEAGPDPRIHAVGADDGSGPQFLVLHPGAEGWVRIPLAESGDLWWVTGVPGDGVWASGSGGRVVRYDAATGDLEDRSTGVDAVLYGVWGSGPGDVWAVGGDPAGVGPRPALLHWDGEGWEAVAAPAAAADRILYKVWGAGPGDVWAVGQGGTLLHYDGSGWEVVDAGTSSTLLTVHGTDPVVAVGGGASAVVVERDPSTGTWARAPVSGVNSGGSGQVPSAVQTLNGVWVSPSREPLAVGGGATVVRREDGGWRGMAGVPAGARDLHAVWVDDAGNAVMVGGALGSLTQGTLLTHGTRRLPSVVATRARLRGGVADLLYTSCAISGCHLPPFLNEGLDLSSPEAVLEHAVGVPSRQGPLLRIRPLRPSQSYLWHKLQGTQALAGGTGDRMPLGEEPLDDAALEAVLGWILDGARDD